MSETAFALADNFRIPFRIHQFAKGFNENCGLGQSSSKALIQLLRNQDFAIETSSE